MRHGYREQHYFDASGNPEGGVSFGDGFCISWQRGPLGSTDIGDRKPPNGAFVEDVIAAVLGRLEFYQKSKFACQENADAIAHLMFALSALDERTREREARGVEGTYAI